MELSDSDSDADAIYDKRTRDSAVGGGSPAKKQNVDGNSPSSVVLPPGFLDPLPQPPATGQACKQFWKAGDYEGFPYGNWDSLTGLISCFLSRHSVLAFVFLVSSLAFLQFLGIVTSLFFGGSCDEVASIELLGDVFKAL